jgi:hypothetical protein
MGSATDPIEAGLTGQHFDDHQMIAARLGEDGLYVGDLYRWKAAARGFLGLRQRALCRQQPGSRATESVKNVASIHGDS